mgnify:CR=1 FL=1|tara:strand:+ start:161 stop:349 length:189 start_codon:yes stop_codon:yes gene_type:complete
MDYNFLNTDNGDAFSMFFETDAQKEHWLTFSPNITCIGIQEYTLPTRHVRMQNKEEFAGWGS